MGSLVPYTILFLIFNDLQVLVLLLTAGLLGVSIWGVYNLRQEFNPVWFIPQSSYFFKFLSRFMVQYPNFGKIAKNSFFIIKKKK